MEGTHLDSHLDSRLDSHRRAVTAARAAADKKGGDILVLDVGDILGIAEVFVITSATNTRQVRTICDEVELAVKQEDGTAPIRVEGLDAASWVLMDYGDLVVHVFLDETREYYSLERLWADAPQIAWEPARATR
jgi:ribosome-associated protein